MLIKNEFTRPGLKINWRTIGECITTGYEILHIKLYHKTKTPGMHSAFLISFNYKL